MRVCVFGASHSAIPAVYIDFARELGMRLADAGHGIVFGAGRTGLMGAVARGAHARGGEIIGVIPKKLNVEGIYFEHCTERIETPTMHQRKATMEELSDCFIALSGGFGTIEELMEVITLKQLGYHNKPIVIVNINGFYDYLLMQLKRCVDEGFTNQMFLQLFSVADSIDGVIRGLEAKEDIQLPDKIAEVLFSSCERTD